MTHSSLTWGRGGEVVVGLGNLGGRTLGRRGGDELLQQGRHLQADNININILKMTIFASSMNKYMYKSSNPTLSLIPRQVWCQIVFLCSETEMYLLNLQLNLEIS